MPRQATVMGVGVFLLGLLCKVRKAHYKHHFCKALETLFLNLALSYALFVCDVESHYPDQ